MDAPDATGTKKSLLLDRVREKIRLKHYSIRTETAYIDWVRRFVVFHHRRHPRELGPEHVEAFLSHLAVQRNVAASTQNQAKSALLFLYKEVLGSELPWLDNVESAKRPQRLPVVLSHTEVDAVLSRMHGTNGLIARLLYGSGLRLMEAVRLRVKNLDLERCEILASCLRRKKSISRKSVKGTLPFFIVKHRKRDAPPFLSSFLGRPYGRYCNAGPVSFSNLISG